MKYIERKSLIYKTEVEYGNYTLNHVLGCSHGCNYPCYAMMLKKRFGEIKDYSDWLEPRLVSNYRELLNKELPKFKNKIEELHLCFTTDPLMYRNEEIIAASIDILHLIADFGINASVLTKGIFPDELHDLPKSNSFGITLISLNEDFRQEMEPGAAPYKERISSLKKMSNLGFRTWVSIEPYPTPNIIEQNLVEILESVKFVDKIIFGKINYSKLANKYTEKDEFFNEMASKVIKFCSENNIQFHIKDGTVKE